MRNRLLVIGAIAGALLLAPMLAGCDSKGGTKRVVCDYAIDSGTFIGRLTALDGSTATFTVDHATPNPKAIRDPLASDAKQVVVHYDLGDEQFLAVGKRYKVRVTATQHSGATPWYVSSVHQDDIPCSGGTTYADGSAIAT